MRCLVDSDILVYELGSCGQYYEEDDVDKERLIIRDFSFVAELIDQRVKEIEEECWSDQPSIFYFTGDEKMIARHNKRNEPIEYKPNFRFDIAVTKPYKGNRDKVVKPFHATNVEVYIMGKWSYKIANGMEADDLIIIDTMKDLDNSIVCTRDKDLRMAGKHHFGWACGKQPQFGPMETDYFGGIELSATKKKITGTGVKFFYAQLLTGDSVDNIPGCPGIGPAKAFKLLDELETELDLYESVKAAYLNVYEAKRPENGMIVMREQADLLWMIREVDDEGEPIFWKAPGA